MFLLRIDSSQKQNGCRPQQQNKASVRPHSSQKIQNPDTKLLPYTLNSATVLDQNSKVKIKTRNFEQVCTSGSSQQIQLPVKSFNPEQSFQLEESLEYDLPSAELIRSSGSSLSTSKSASDVIKKRKVKIFEQISKLPLSRVHIPSAQQLSRFIDRRTTEKCVKTLTTESKTSVQTRLFALYKFKNKGVFNSTMHFYKRDLSPVRENFVMQNIVFKGSPYKQNFQNYEVNIATNDFKKILLRGMGENVTCLTSQTKNNKQSIQTFSKKNQVQLSVDHNYLLTQSNNEFVVTFNIDSSLLDGTFQQSQQSASHLLNQLVKTEKITLFNKTSIDLELNIRFSSRSKNIRKTKLLTSSNEQLNYETNPIVNPYANQQLFQTTELLMIQNSLSQNKPNAAESVAQSIAFEDDSPLVLFREDDISIAECDYMQHQQDSLTILKMSGKIKMPQTSQQSRRKGLLNHNSSREITPETSFPRTKIALVNQAKQPIISQILQKINVEKKSKKKSKIITLVKQKLTRPPMSKIVLNKTNITLARLNNQQLTEPNQTELLHLQTQHLQIKDTASNESDDMEKFLKVEDKISVQDQTPNKVGQDYFEKKQFFSSRKKVVSTSRKKYRGMTPLNLKGHRTQSSCAVESLPQLV